MAAAESTFEVSDLLRQLGRLERRVRLVALFNGLGLAALLIAAVVAVAIVADTIWDLSLQVRLGLLVTAGVVAIAGILWAITRSFLRRSDPAAMAALVESAYPELHERLSSAIEWEREKGSGGSALMRALVVEQAGKSLSELDLVSPVPMSRASRRGVMGAGALVALLTPCLFFAGYRLTLQRFATPWQNLERVSNLYLEVTPGDASVARGADVEITATPKWRFAKTEVNSATLHWRDATGKRYERQMTWQPDQSTFVATVAHVLEPFYFQIAAGQSRTREFRIDVVDRPLLTSVTATIEPPPYSGRAVEQIEGAVGELEMLSGSRVQLSLQFNLPVEKVDLEWTPDSSGDATTESATVVEATVGSDEMSAEVAFAPEQSGGFEFKLFDVIGPVDLQEPQRRIRLIDDAPPTVVFTDRAAPRAGARDVLRFPLAATDDIGLAALELHYEVVGRDGTANHTPADVPLLGVRSIEHEFSLDLQPLALAEGAVVAVRVRATDERPDPGPNESWTEQRLITITDQSDPYESDALAERQQQLSQTLQQLRAAVEKNLTTTDELRSDAAARNKAGQAFDRDVDVTDLATSDQATVEDAERLAAQLELHPLLAPLGERTRNVGRQQLTAATSQTTSAKDASLAEKAPTLGKAYEELAQAKIELDALQRDLEHLAELEQDLLELQRLADDADRLAKDVAGLKQSEAKAAERSPTDPPDVQEQLRAMAADRLRMDHADLSQRLDHLLDRRPELLDAAAEHSLDQLAALRDQALEMAAREQQLASALESEKEPAPPDAKEDSPENQQLDELRDRQTQMVEQAVQQALDAAESPNADPAALAEIAAQAGSAADALKGGDLNAAAQAAQQAAQRATAAADAGQSSKEALREFAAQQAAIAEQLATAAGSPQARAAARQRSQEQLATGAQQLEQQFQQIAEELTADPLARTDDGTRATESGAATRQAQDFMTTSATAQSASEMAPAATAAREAVKHLELAAEQALSATANAPDSPVPTEVGQQVAQASRQLRRAGEQLAGTSQSKEGAESAEGAEQASREGGESKSEQAAGDEQSQSQEGKGDEQGEGDGKPQGETDDLAEAAAALQKAAQQLKPREPGDRESSSEQMAGQQPGESKESNPAADGSGSTETARLTDLAAKLKARAARNWGELPGELRSELQQRTQSRPDADYAPLIRMYFDEISRRPSPTPESPQQP
jgi:hypothetical protein